MTAVAGILNKRGIAIAADSAVTMNRDGREKIANSANKMLRLSSANPISVMITGCADFIMTPWDIIIRRYRQKRGEQLFSTVEACVEDFFAYIPTEKMFLPDDSGRKFLKKQLSIFWTKTIRTVPNLEIDKDSCTVTNDEAILEEFHRRFKTGIEDFRPCGTMPMFQDYSLEQFKVFLGDMVDRLLEEKTIDEDLFVFGLDDDVAPNEYTKDILDQIKDELTECFYYYVTSRWFDRCTDLIFSGFGEDEEYPVLIRAIVKEGFDGRVCYYINEDDIHKISDKNPVAICSYAQDDIMEALLTGIHPDFYNALFDETKHAFYNFTSHICSEATDDFESYSKLMPILEKVRFKDLIRLSRKFSDKLRQAEKNQWLKALYDYDLQAMAKLAENLIAMTGFERHMTFSDEGVGGPVDVAVITKHNGFTWLNRKSWYHHKDVAGLYGKFGV